MRKVMLSPSILDTNIVEIKTTMGILNRAKAEYVHFDIMDGNFVPALTYGAKIMKPLRSLTSIKFDTHLMINNPEKYADGFIEAGADLIMAHQEAVKDIDSFIKQIKSQGRLVGLSIKPNTPADTLFKFMDRIDMVLVMSVEPGFGGQKFMPASLEKVKTYRKIIDDNKYNCLIEIDGGINVENAPLAAAAGADVLVAGSAVFGAKDPEQAIYALRTAANK